MPAPGWFMGRLVVDDEAARGGVGPETGSCCCCCCGIWPGGGVPGGGTPSVVWILAVDLRFLNPKLLSREFIWKGEGKKRRKRHKRNRQVCKRNKAQ